MPMTKLFGDAAHLRCPELKLLNRENIYIEAGRQQAAMFHALIRATEEIHLADGQRRETLSGSEYFEAKSYLSGITHIFIYSRKAESFHMSTCRIDNENNARIRMPRQTILLKTLSRDDDSRSALDSSPF